MVEHLVRNASSREIYIYWGMPIAKDFYSALPQELDEKFEQIHFVPVVSGDDQHGVGEKVLFTMQ